MSASRWPRRLAVGAALVAACSVVLLLALRWQAATTLAAIEAAGNVAARSDRADEPDDATNNAKGKATSDEAALLARGIALARVGRDDAALAAYRRVEAGRDEALRRAARFNTANLHLRQASALLAAGDQAGALPLIELAKGLYRQLLVEDHTAWDVRYNLERAVRLLPEESGSGNDNGPPPQNSERAVTTMRARSMGLP